MTGYRFCRFAKQFAKQFAMFFRVLICFNCMKLVIPMTWRGVIWLHMRVIEGRESGVGNSN